MKSKRAFLLAFVAVPLLGLSAQRYLAAYTQTDSVAKLSLIILDKNDNQVETVNAAEVQIKEDKKDLKIRSVEVDNRPMDLAIMLDTSGSLRSQFDEAKSVVEHIIKTKRESDRVFIGRFVDTPHIETVVECTSNDLSSVNPLRNLKVMAGQSAVIDALYFGANKIARCNGDDPGRRKVLIAVTDGEDRNSQRKLKELLSLIQKEKVQIFVLGLTQELDREDRFIRASPKDKAEELLSSITKESGGRVFLTNKKIDSSKATAALLDQLRHQFMMSFEPGNTVAGFHQIEVNHAPTTGPRHKLIAPRGYLVK